MLSRLKDWVKRWLDITPRDEERPVDEFKARYEDIRRGEIPAAIAYKLAMITLGDSTLEITEKGGGAESRRTALIRGIAADLWRNDFAMITAQAYGKGGKLLIPVVLGDKISVSVIDQARMAVRAMDGRRITAATIIADAQTIEKRKYFLLADYRLENGGQAIRYHVVDESGSAAEIQAFERWAALNEITIQNVDRLLMAYLRCPRDNRSEEQVYGVPITYGAEGVIAELEEHMATYRREYRLTRPMLGLDQSLWLNTGSKNPKPMGIEGIRRTVQDSDDPFIPTPINSFNDKNVWPYFAPGIRDTAMETRYNSLCRRIEKACGLSQGILTERQSMNYANRDEVRAAQYETFSTVTAMRRNWESAMEDLCYAIDALAERFGITPVGARDRYEIAIDWDMSLIESSTQTFAQMSELNSRGMVADVEMRQWVMGGTTEENEAAIAEIQEKRGAGGIDKLLSGIAAGTE